MPTGYAILAWNILLTSSSTGPESEALSQIDTAKEQKRRNNLKLVALLLGCLLIVAYLWIKL